MRVLGLSAFHRDAAAALVVDGRTVAAAAEERFSREKHDAAFPRRAVRSCLAEGGIGARDLDWVVFAEKPSRRFERLLAGEISGFPGSWRSFPKVLVPWLGDRLWTRSRICDELSVDAKKVLFVESQRARAANAFFNSGFDEAAVLVADEALEWAAATLARGKTSELEVLAEVHHPHSLGLLAVDACEHLGLGGAEALGRLFALAGWGEPRHAEAIAAALKLESDGSYTLDPAALGRALGSPREPGSPLRWKAGDSAHADLAASAVKALGDALVHLARELHRRAPLENLCFGGELASSADLNARLLAEGPFRRLFVPPAPGDSGAALGAALAVAHELEKPARVPLAHAFLGEDVRAGDAGGTRLSGGEDEVVEKLADALASGSCAGWARGRFEWGARSLGHRVILASPLREGVREHVAAAVKRREPFLPMCCAIPAEHAAELFDLPAGAADPARFLQMSAPSRNGAKASLGVALGAALHADRRARPQLVDAAVDPHFHRLLVRFGEKTGVPVLLTTSLNLRGDPIARGEADAVAVLQRSGLDLLAVEDQIFARE